MYTLKFQSTHPSWGATYHPVVVRPAGRNFNPRTHRGVRLYDFPCDFPLITISIHAPIVGCDILVKRWLLILDYFNPRTHRGVRQDYYFEFQDYTWISIHAPIVGCDITNNSQTHINTSISIHAPIVGCDVINASSRLTSANFNPRTHRGVRLLGSCGSLTDHPFQSTHPSWGATQVYFGANDCNRYFNPRTHRGVRRE